MGDPAPPTADRCHVGLIDQDAVFSQFTEDNVVTEGIGLPLASSPVTRAAACALRLLLALRSALRSAAIALSSAIRFIGTSSLVMCWL